MHSEIVLEVSNLSKTYAVRKSIFSSQRLYALQNVSLSLKKSSVLAIIGESGSGKSTLAKILMKLEQADQGQVKLSDKGVTKLFSQISNHDYYQRIQMVFQDPYSSLNPRRKIANIVAAPLFSYQELSASEKLNKVEEVLNLVGLDNSYMDKYPHQISGGQRQRINIARAIIRKPSILILDESLSALDLSIQAQILNLLARIKYELKLSYIFISHDLAVVKHFSDEIVVFNRGNIVERGQTADVLSNPTHSYTKQLIKSNLTTSI